MGAVILPKIQLAFLPNKMEDMNQKVTKSRTIVKHISCKCRFEFEGRKCNSRQKWNSDKCQCECEKANNNKTK